MVLLYMPQKEACDAKSLTTYVTEVMLLLAGKQTRVQPQGVIARVHPAAVDAFIARPLMLSNTALSILKLLSSVINFMVVVGRFL